MGIRLISIWHGETVRECIRVSVPYGDQVNFNRRNVHATHQNTVSVPYGDQVNFNGEVGLIIHGWWFPSPMGIRLISIVNRARDKRMHSVSVPYGDQVNFNKKIGCNVCVFGVSVPYGDQVNFNKM